MKPKRIAWVVFAVLVLTVVFALGYPRLAVPSLNSDREHSPEKHGTKSDFPLSFSLIATGEAVTSEAFVVEGGSLLKKRGIIHTAVLVRHPKASFLFDTGLGTRVAEEFRQHEFYKRPLLAYKNPKPAVLQLKEAGIDPDSIRHIFVSHLHWDHASGIKDFPSAEIHVSPEEKGNAPMEGAKKGYIPSQYSGTEIRWQPIVFEDRAYESYAKSKDWFGDGTVVFVPLSGHTAGSIGMFLNLAEDRRYFFTGDTTWSKEGFDLPAHKPRGSRWLVDLDPELLGRELDRVHRLGIRLPNLMIVPAHDKSVQEKIGFFPRWIR
ncbi:MBL fold metallo-hydrolase [Leptospira fletcheri]|uniref:MBL fold metallo-hydrolase n=1 Tax=Leptospira fletcheri TaxID=2484981 RepID=A0A4R9GHV5_9LEPT|nr:MBL fold metallo-hydrolase [Leptospira fletcheri]TGK12342.1 MBL fold metallo-hydrolase [Leptospira fletcheri]